MTRDDFTAELERIFHEATSLGAPTVVVKSGDLHRRVGGYPNGGDHAMPSCCDAMYAAQRTDDRILQSPPKGKGATLTIEYRLPR